MLNIFWGMCFRIRIPAMAPTAIRGKSVAFNFRDWELTRPRFIMNGNFIQLTMKKNHAAVPTNSVFGSPIASR